MNKKAQTNWEELIKLIIFLPLIIALFGSIFGVLNSINQENCPDCPSCPVCNCSQYINNLTICFENLENKTIELNERPVNYIHNTTYVEIPKETVVYKEKFIPGIAVIFSFGLSILLTLSLFRIKVQLPKWVDKLLEKVEKCKKLVSIVISILMLIKVVSIFF